MLTEGECKQLEWTWMTSSHSIQMRTNQTGILHYMDDQQVIGLRQRFSLQGITRVVENSQSRAPEDIALVLTTCEDVHQALEESLEIPMTNQECAGYKINCNLAMLAAARLRWEREQQEHEEQSQGAQYPTSRSMDI